MEKSEENNMKYTEITENEIKINFIVDGEEYIVLNSPSENENILIAKLIDIDEETKTIISVTDEEYEKAFNEYISLIELIGDEENVE